MSNQQTSLGNNLEEVMLAKKTEKWEGYPEYGLLSQISWKEFFDKGEYHLMTIMMEMHKQKPPKSILDGKVLEKELTKYIAKFADDKEMKVMKVTGCNESDCEELMQLKSLVTICKIAEFKPLVNEEKMQECYKKLISSFIEDGPSFSPLDYDIVFDLCDLTGVKPKLSDDFIQDCYKKAIINAKTSAVWYINKVFGVIPDIDNETAQIGYDFAVKSGTWTEIEEIKKITGINPVISKKSYDEGFWKCLTGNNFDNVANFINQTKTKPSDQIVQDGWLYILSTCIPDNYCKWYYWAVGSLPDENTIKIIMDSYKTGLGNKYSTKQAQILLKGHGENFAKKLPVLVENLKNNYDKCEYEF